MNVYVLSTLEIGIDIIGILKRHLDLAGVIGLSAQSPGDAVSGYRHLAGWCAQNGLPFIEVQSYGLSDAADRQRLLALEVDVLIVAGWQRLIPAWLIDHCKVCAVGSHGSTRGITGGRGRSPQNWALLLGEKEFYISIFRIDPGIDSGSVIDTRKYVLSPFDTIRTSYYKVCWLTAHMIADSFRSGRILGRDLEEQSGEARYLPQRLPEDGEIDWSRSAARIHDFVRALTRPYPGAYSRLGGATLTVWRCMPFEIETFGWPGSPGEVVKVFSSGEFLVCSGDSFVLVEDYTIDPPEAGPVPTEGTVLPSADFKAQMRRIVARHRRRHPDLAVSEQILDEL